MAQALGHQACRKGYDVVFTKAVKLFRFLLAGRADHSWEKRTKKYLHPDLLIIDDFGLAAMTRHRRKTSTKSSLNATSTPQ